MAVDSNNLISGIAPIDVAGSINKGNTVLQNRISTENAQQEHGDQQVIRDLAAVPGVDFTTPKGIGEFMNHLQGRVNPATILHLGEMKTKMEDAENARVIKLATLGDKERQQYDDTIDMTMSAFDGVDKITNSDERKAEIANRLEAYRGKKTASGQPVYSDQAIDSLAQMPWEQQQSIYKGSKHAKELSLRAKEEAETLKNTQLAAESKARTENPEIGDQYTSPSSPGKAYLKGKRGITEVDTTTGEKTPVPALPADATKTGTGAGVKAAQAKELLDFEKNPPTAEEDQMARVYRVTRKMESLGQNSPLRPRIALLAAKQAIDEGRDVVGDNATYKAESSNVANLTKQYGVIKAGEQTVLGNLELIKPIIAKVDSTGVPALERWIRAGKKSVEGDPDVTQLNALLTSTTADIGKVLSASTGAGGVPVAALEEAKKYLDGNLTLDQFNALYEIVPKEMAVRTDKMEAQIAGSINKINRLVGGKTGAPTPAPANPDAITETDARQELMKAREAFRTATDPKQKEMAGKVVASLEQKLGGAGGKAPTERAMSKSGKPMVKVDGKWVYE